MKEINEEEKNLNTAMLDEEKKRKDALNATGQKNNTQSSSADNVTLSNIDRKNLDEDFNTRIDRELERIQAELKSKPRPVVKPAVISGLSIIATYKDLAKDLKEFKEEFLKNQVDPNANRNSNSPEEGPQDYRNILNQIDTMIAYVNSGPKNSLSNANMQAVENDLKQMLKSVNQYCKDHKPRFIGHRSVESAHRYDIMGKLADKTSLYASQIKKYTTKMASDAKKDNLPAIDLKEVTLNNFQNKLGSTFDQKDIANYTGVFDGKAGLSREVSEEKMYKDRIFKYLNEHTDNLKTKEFYKNVTTVDPQNDMPLRSTKTASTYDLAEAGLVRHYLRQMKEGRLSNNQLGEMSRKFVSGDLKKEVASLANSPGFAFSLEMYDMTKSKEDKTFLAEKIIDTTKKIIKTNNYKLDKLRNANPKKDRGLVALERNGGINDNLMFKVADNIMGSKPENIDIMLHISMCRDEDVPKAQQDAITQDIQNTAIKFFKASGLADKYKGKSVDNLKNMIKDMENPKFQKAFADAMRKTATKSFEKTKSARRQLIQRRAFIHDNPEAYSKEIMDGINKHHKEVMSVEEYNDRISEKRKDLLEKWNDTDKMPKDILNYVPGKDPAYAIALKDMYNKNPHMELLNIKYNPKDIKAIREAHNLKAPKTNTTKTNTNAKTKPTETKKKDAKKGGRGMGGRY